MSGTRPSLAVKESFPKRFSGGAPIKTSRSTSLGWRSARATATNPPIEWPAIVARRTPSIRKDLRAVRELLESDAGRFPVGTSVEIRYKIEGREPTTQERLERVEKQVQDLVGVEGRLRSEYQGEIAMRVGAVVRWLNEQLSGGIGRRWWGVGLFGAGAFLSGLANVFGALS